MRISIPSALLLINLITVTFFSCDRKEAGIGKRVGQGQIHLGARLNVAIGEKVSVFLPNHITSAVSSEIGSHLHDGLLKLDARTLKVVPGLAESWSVDETGRSYVFSLRKRALFHADPCFGNGSREITADDFEYSFRQLCSEDSKAFATTFRNRVEGANEFHDGASSTITGVVVIDDYTLKISLLKPDPSFLFVLAQPSTAVISEKAMKEYGERTTVGAGPFAFSSSEKDLVLIRNKDYYVHDAYNNRLPYLDTLVFRTIEGKDNQLEAFFNDRIDIVSGLYLDPVKRILDQHVADFSGSSPKYVMERDSESVGYEAYSIYRANVKGLENNFLGYRDFSWVEIEQ